MSIDWQRIWREDVRSFGSVVTIVTGVTLLFGWLVFAPKAPALDAKVEQEATPLPPSVVDSLRLLAKKPYDDAIRGELKSGDPLYEAMMTATRLVDSPDRAISALTAQIVNNGDQTLESVALTLPEVAVSQVTREDGKKQLADNGPIVQIGSLAPGEHVQVVAWDDLRWRLDGITIRHRTGRGTVQVWDRVSPTWVWLQFNWKFFAPAAFWITILIGAGLVRWGEHRAKYKLKSKT